MKYMGSKNRHAKEILPIVLNGRLSSQWYVEPFVGGFNLIDKVDGLRLGNDIHPYLIALFRALQEGWVPPITIDENLYNTIRESKDKYPDYLVGYVGFNSFGGKFFGGYRRDSIGKRDYWKEHYNNVIKQKSKLEGIVISNKNYLDLEIPPNSIIYCDPPYSGTTKYSNAFNHEIFWEWVRYKAQDNTVFVSEYSAPKDFVSVWCKTINNTLVRDTGSRQGTEHLFTLKA